MTLENLCPSFNFNQHICQQILFLHCLNTMSLANVVVTGSFLRLILLQHGDIIFHVATEVSIVYYPSIFQRFPKSKHTIHSIVMTLTAY